MIGGEAGVEVGWSCTVEVPCEADRSRGSGGRKRGWGGAALLSSPCEAECSLYMILPYGMH